MTRMMRHQCPGCAKPIKVERFACGGCWRRIPGDLRTAIVRAWGRRKHGVTGAVGEHLKAKTAAAEWLEQNPREEGHK
jgi:predicted amidophosphoribosyltransferase